MRTLLRLFRVFASNDPMYRLTRESVLSSKTNSGQLTIWKWGKLTTGISVIPRVLGAFTQPVFVAIKNPLEFKDFPGAADWNVMSFRRRGKRSAAVFLLLYAFCPFTAAAEGTSIRLYLDADRTGVLASTLSIERGIRTALSEVDNLLDGRPVEIVSLDHRGSSPRSRRDLERYLEDDSALAVFSGLHSPPLLAHRDFINQQRILLLDPWAAAGPITRSDSPENWIFRLSVDDSKAGEVLVSYVIDDLKAHTPHLLLESTGWGRSNEKTTQRALESRGLPKAEVHWFNWNLQESTARILLRKIADAGGDVILLVANAPEGKTLSRAMGSLPPAQRRQIVSHWGITGGDFAEVIDREIRSRFSLSFLETRFSFVSQSEDPFGRSVFERARRLFPEDVQGSEDITAPTGFIHAYDLTRLLISAVAQAHLTGKIEDDRRRVHTALENLEQSVRGLIKTYKKPFRHYDDTHIDAHEALELTDFAMARYREDGAIVLFGSHH